MVSCLSLFLCLSAPSVYACTNDYECGSNQKCYIGENYQGFCIPTSDFNQIEDQKKAIEKLKKQQEEIKNKTRGLGTLGPIGPTGTLNSK